ncbi:MAG: helix-turn-helix domain-containing protein [Candidatus Avispirillum sp.]
MFNMNEIGNKISLLRKSANLTQMELANRLGISFQAVSNWERGISMPDISNLGLLAEILGVTVDELIGDKKVSDIITGADTPDSITVEEFNAVSPLLSPEKNRELLDVITTDGMTEQSAEKLSDSVNLAACSFDSAEISAVAEKAYRNGNVSIFSVLKKYLDNDTRNRLLTDAIQAGKPDFTAMLAKYADSETLEKHFYTAFNAGDCALVAILSRYASYEACAHCFNTSVENDCAPMVAILSRRLSKLSKRRKAGIDTSETRE